MSVTNKQAKDRIINALSDLYRVERHSSGIAGTQRKAVEDATAALEAEYIAILTSSGPATYAKITNAFKQARSNLEEIVKKRADLANSFVSTAKILGSLTQVLKLF